MIRLETRNIASLCVQDGQFVRMGKVSLSSWGFVGRTQAVTPAPLLCWVDYNFWSESSGVGGGGAISKRELEEEKVKNRGCLVLLR